MTIDKCCSLVVSLCKNKTLVDLFGMVLFEYIFEPGGGQ